MVCIISAILMRPVEAAANLLLPLSFYLFTNLRQKTISIRNVATISGWILLGVAMWYLPFYKRTFEWIYRTSFGDVAAADGRSPLEFWANLHLQIFYAGLIPFFTMLTLASVTIVLNKFKNIFTTQMIYLFLLIPIPLIEVFLTIQNSPRKMAIPFTALFMIAALIGLKKGRLWILRLSVINLLLMLQFIAAILLAMNMDYPRLISYTMSNIPKPTYLKTDPYVTISDYIIDSHVKFKFKHISLVISTEGKKPVDPFLSMTVAMAKSSDLKTYFSFFNEFNEDTIKSMNNFDAILLAEESDKLRMSAKSADYYLQLFNNSKPDSDKTRYYFLYNFTAGKLKSIGWRVADCKDMISLNNENYRTCILIKAESKDKRII